MAETRYHAIDKLRAMMILAVVFGHAMLPYVTWPRRFKDPDATIIIDVLGVFIYSFAMQVFFVTAGFSAALLLERRGARGLLRNRWHRIFLPFVAAWIVLAPLTRAAYQFARDASAQQTLQAGIDAVLRGGWLDWSKIYHLWFLPALFLFTLMALGCHYLVHMAGPGFPARVASLSHRFLASRWRVALLSILLAIPVILAYLVGNGAARYALLGVGLFEYFVLGWLIYRQRDLLPSFRGQAPWLFVIALLFLPPTVWSMRLRLFQGGDVEPLVGLVSGLGNTFLAACMTLGLLGLFQSRFNQPSPVWRYFSDASYWIYLVHFPLVIFVGALFSLTSMPALVKYALTVSIVISIIVASYHFGVRRSSLGGVLIGGKGKARTQ